MDVVDILDDSQDEAAAPEPPTAEQLQQAIRSYLLGKDLSTISLKALRKDLELSFNVGAGGFDARKDEIRQIAQELVQAAQAQQAEAEAVPEPPQKRQKSVLATAGEGGTAEAPEAVGPPAKKQKKQNGPSAYNLWGSEQRASVYQSLEQQLNRKPSLGEVGKALGERWKAVAEAEKALFEQRSKVAKAQLAADGPAAAVAAPPKKAIMNSEGKGRGKGKGKDKRGTAPEGSLTRADFLRGSPSIRCAMSLTPGSSVADLNLPHMDMAARTFKSGGVGYHSSIKFDLPIAGQQVTVTANLVINVGGSKYWNDGEGFSDLAASAPAEPAEGEDGKAEALAPVNQVQEVPEVATEAPEQADAEVPLEAQPSTEEAPTAEASPGKEVAEAEGELPEAEAPKDNAADVQDNSEQAVEAHGGA